MLVILILIWFGRKEIKSKLLPCIIYHPLLGQLAHGPTFPAFGRGQAGQSRQPGIKGAVKSNLRYLGRRFALQGRLDSFFHKAGFEVFNRAAGDAQRLGQVGEADEARLRCSWDTTPEDVDAFAADLAKLVKLVASTKLK